MEIKELKKLKTEIKILKYGLTRRVEMTKE